MTIITGIVLHNFRKYRNFKTDFRPDIDVLIGDNEAGKSSILLAIDLALSGNRTKVESVGIDALFNVDAVAEFMASERKIENLPEFFIEIYLSEQQNDDLSGRNNSRAHDCDGIRLLCAPIEDYSKEISEVLAQEDANFPYEFYSLKFATFADHPYNGYTRPLRHLLLDSSQISSDHANREYTRAIYGSNVDALDRSKHQNEYRRYKSNFRDNVLAELNKQLENYQFAVRTSAKTNLETDLHIVENSVPIEQKGKGRQCFIKTEFALKRVAKKRGIHVLLLEEPENHLSHVNMRLLVQKLAASSGTQLFIATHSSMICTRLDLRSALMLSQDGSLALLKDLSNETAEFFMKAPDNNILEFILAKKVMLVEGDAEYMLMDAFYKKISGSTPEEDGVHILAIGGTSFKRYMELANLLGIRTAAVRDNDKDFQKNCVSNYADYVNDKICVFADDDNSRSTFEICVYRDNSEICEMLWAGGRVKLTVQEYMLANKAEVALELLKKHHSDLAVPKYITEAIKWIRT